MELYNQARDLGETRNLAAAEHERAARLTAQLQAWRRGVDANMPRPSD